MACTLTSGALASRVSSRSPSLGGPVRTFTLVLAHPSVSDELVRTKVREVAVVAWPDIHIDERVCAVVVPRGEPPTPDEPREHLHRLGMSDPYWPERLEITAQPGYGRVPSSSVSQSWRGSPKARKDGLVIRSLL